MRAAMAANVRQARCYDHTGSYKSTIVAFAVARLTITSRETAADCRNVIDTASSIQLGPLQQLRLVRRGWGFICLLV